MDRDRAASREAVIVLAVEGPAAVDSVLAVEGLAAVADSVLVAVVVGGPAAVADSDAEGRAIIVAERYAVFALTVSNILITRIQIVFAGI